MVLIRLKMTRMQMVLMQERKCGTMIERPARYGTIAMLRRSKQREKREATRVSRIGRADGERRGERRARIEPESDGDDNVEAFRS
jgi:hypothetical protein